MKIKIKSESGRLPSYESREAAGMDVQAYLSEDMILASGERKLVPTGLYIEVPSGYEAQMRARSGLAIRNGIGLVNGIGTIDADYRGELKVPLINWGDEDFVIHDGDRIAQMVITSYTKAELVEVEELSDTERGEGGFGHTGV